jgi:hypothetical protein
MKSELAKKLKEVLDSMSQEQFDQAWGSVTALGMEGPSFSDAIHYITVESASLKHFELLNAPNSNVVKDDCSMFLAA